MVPDTLSLAGRLEAVLESLGVERMHVVACMSGDWAPLLSEHADRICSLTVVAPHLNKGVPETLHEFTTPSLVIAGDQGGPAERARKLVSRFAQGQLTELRDYSSPAWADTIADKTTAVTEALERHFESADIACGAPSEIAANGAKGEVAGISYRIDGNGPAIVFLPLSMAPSQWDPLVPRLSERHAVIRLGGPHLGVISLLEARARSGYGDLVADILRQTNIGADETVLEVGCGSGALARRLANQLNGRNPIVGADLNPYLLAEAQALAASEGLGETIRFEEANAEELPYSNDQFDVAYCSTVLEEGDADRMFAELIRVTRPGGRIAVITRAIDVDWWVNLALPSELKRTVERLGPSTGSGVGEKGCADASLYARATNAGLTLWMMGPQFAIYRPGDRLTDVLDRLVAQLPDSDAEICRKTIHNAERDGVLFVAEPYHCAVGTVGF